MVASGILATSARHNKDTGTDIIGAMTSLKAFGYPINPQLVAYYQIEYTPTKEKEVFNFQLLLMDPGGRGEPVQKVTIQTNSQPGQLAISELTMEVPKELCFAAGGIFRFILACNGNPIHSLSLRVYEATEDAPSNPFRNR